MLFLALILVITLLAGSASAEALPLFSIQKPTTIAPYADEPVTAAWRIALSGESFSSGKLLLPVDGGLALVVEERFPSFFGAESIVGTVAGTEGTSVITRLNGAFAGVVAAPRALYEIRPVTGGHVLLRLDRRGFHECEGGVTESEAKPETLGARFEAMRQLSQKSASPRSEVSRIDILVLYEQTAISALGGQLQVHATNTVIFAERALIQSEIDNVSFNLVGVEALNYTSNGSSATQLARLRYKDGEIDEARILRDAYRADLVSLIMDDLPNSCGRGYVGVGNPEWAYTIVDLGCIPNHTFTHEIGHNMGCAHNREDAGSSGEYPFSYGHRVPGSFRTVMAYSCEDVDCDRFGLFSNPDIRVGGTPAGVPIGLSGESHNAETIHLTGGVVVDYRDDLAPPTVTPTPRPTATPIVGVVLAEEVFDSLPLCDDDSDCDGDRTACDLPGSFLQNVDGDDGDWYVNTRDTFSDDTGPLEDFTTGYGRYVYTEASGDCHNRTFILESRPVSLPAGTMADLQYHVHMYGCNMGTLSVEIDAGGFWQELDRITDDRDVWQVRYVDLSAYAGTDVRLRFVGVTGGRGCSDEFESDMALDDVRIVANATTPPTPAPLPTTTPLPPRPGGDWLWMRATYDRSELALAVRLHNDSGASLPTGSLFLVAEIAGVYYFLPTFAELAAPFARLDLSPGVDTGIVEVARYPVPPPPQPLLINWLGVLLYDDGRLSFPGVAEAPTLLR